MSQDRPPSSGPPGALTSLLNEVFRGTPANLGWADGLTPGSALGRYDLIREIGRGGFAAVWEARDRELGRRVAVKVLRGNRAGVYQGRLVAEAEVAARLGHPGIVTTLDIGHNESGVWLVQEFLVGRTLAERVEAGPVPLREALAIETKVSEALAYAHRNGVVHRDLTLGNVFLCDDGQVKLLDLGMAQAFGRRKLEGGTPEFMAPEQALGEPEDERVDVYALGVLLHRLLTGRPPFSEKTPPDRRLPPHLITPELPGLGELVDRMLAQAPRDRPRDAGEVLTALETLTSTLPRTTSVTGPGRVLVRRRWPPWAQRTLVTLLLAGALGLGAWGGSRAGKPPAPQEPGMFGSVSTSSTCRWTQAAWFDLDRMPAGAITRNGDMGGQGVAEASGRKAWVVDSDWGGLFIPVGSALRGDPFAVEVEFFVPPLEGWERGAELGVLTDPMEKGAAGVENHGFGISVQETPGKSPWFQMRGFEPTAGRPRHQYAGTLPAHFAGKWHTLRIEGSRTERWFRGLFDGIPLSVAYGDLDTAGAYVKLGAGYGYTHPEYVAFSNLRFFHGTADCR